MSPRLLAGGSLSGKTWSIHVTDKERSTLFDGYTLPDDVFDQLVDHDVEYIVFIDPNRGRYTSTVEDWQSFGVQDGRSPDTHLRQSWMDRG